jgi:hypothetical protein
MNRFPNLKPLCDRLLFMQNIRQISQEIISKEMADLRFALVEYRDHPPQEKTFVTNVLDFTNRLDEMKSRLDKCSANGGRHE